MQALNPFKDPFVLSPVVVSLEIKHNRKHAHAKHASTFMRDLPKTPPRTYHASPHESWAHHRHLRHGGAHHAHGVHGAHAHGHWHAPLAHGAHHVGHALAHGAHAHHLGVHGHVGHALALAHHPLAHALALHAHAHHRAHAGHHTPHGVPVHAAAAAHTHAPLAALALAAHALAPHTARGVALTWAGDCQMKACLGCAQVGVRAADISKLCFWHHTQINKTEEPATSPASVHPAGNKNLDHLTAM